MVKHESYLAGTLELLLVKVKVSTQSTNREQRAQQCGLVRHQGGTVGVLLVLGFEFGQGTYETRKEKKKTSTCLSNCEARA